jgi:quercetin dioxygenase-like cupin family protein
MNELEKAEYKLSMRSKIQKLEEDLLTLANDDTIVAGDNEGLGNKLAPLKHSFADGVYVRQMSMPEGTAVVGKIHKRDHVWFLLEGEISVATEERVEEYIAPCYVTSSGGTKRVILALEDSIFVNIHPNPTNTEDLVELEKYNVVTSYEEYEQYINNKKQ